MARPRRNPRSNHSAGEADLVTEDPQLSLATDARTTGQRQHPTPPRLESPPASLSSGSLLSNRAKS